MAMPKPKIVSSLLVTVIITILALTCQGRNVLLSGQKLDPRQSLVEGSYSLRMQNSCNLALYDGSRIIWLSNTAFPNRRCSAHMQTNGRLVISDVQNNVVWATANTGHAGQQDFVLVLQKDRNLVIYGPRRWATGSNIRSVGGIVHTVVNGTVGGGFIESQNVSTMIAGEISNATSVRRKGPNVLLSEQRLNEGQSLDEGSYSLKMQNYCNLALYDGSEAVWLSHRGSLNGRCSAHMQRGGNFVIYDRRNNPVWASNSGQGNSQRIYILVLQKDRNVAIYGPAIWHTQTYKRRVGGVVHTVPNGMTSGGFIESQSVGTMIVGEKRGQNATAVGKVAAAP